MDIVSLVAIIALALAVCLVLVIWFIIGVALLASYQTRTVSSRATNRLADMAQIEYEAQQVIDHVSDDYLAQVYHLITQEDRGADA